VGPLLALLPQAHAQPSTDAMIDEKYMKTGVKTLVSVSLAYLSAGGR
jgi:hypothetical protein